MTDLFARIGHAFEAGGVFIYPIHVIAILTLAITIERIYVLYAKSSMNIKNFIQQLAPTLARGDLQSGMQFCDSISAPGARVAKSLLVRALAKGQREDIDAMIEASLARESHPIERRTSYLSMLANISTLLGLLGTISGLILSFAAAAKSDPTQKAELLALGISEAMNCTAYGLCVAIFGLITFAFLQGKTQTLIDQLKEVAFEVKTLLPLKK